MTLRINSEAPNFTAQTTQGDIDFHNWLGDGWGVLFSHPKDFTPVCTTELGYMAGLEPEFAKRNCKIIGLSIDPVENHANWANDIEDEEAGDGRTAMTNATVRSVFIIDPDKKIKLMMTYPMTTGRNFDEILRVLDSIQLTAQHKVATPVNWRHGEDVIITPAVSDDEAKDLFPGYTTIKPYLRTTKQPG